MRFALALILGLLCLACAEPEPVVVVHREVVTDPVGEVIEQETLSLRPRLEPIGITRVDDRLTLTHLDFHAEIFLLPETIGGGHTSDAVGLEFNFEEGDATTSSDRALRVEEAGRYQVLVRVRPGAEGHSVRLMGRLDHEAQELTLLNERGEAGPIAARDKEEAGPIAARDSEEAGPIAARELEEAGPIAARDSEEAGPIAARDKEEAGPIAARDSEEAGPIAARDKEEAGPIAARDEEVDRLGFTPDALSALPLAVQSEEAFEFYAGVVEIGDDAQELLVTWDVRFWIRTLLADVVELDVHEAVLEPGFQDMPSEFRLIAR